MMLLRTNTGRSPQGDVWTASIDLGSDPDEVLRALTDPAVIAQWAPVSFEVDGLAGTRLRAGSQARVSGSIAGIRTTFDVEVRSADRERLELVARGPVSLDVTYWFDELQAGVRVDAQVGIRREARPDRPGTAGRCGSASECGRPRLRAPTARGFAVSSPRGRPPRRLAVARGTGNPPPGEGGPHA